MASIRHLFHIMATNDEVYSQVAQAKNIQEWWTKDTSGDDQIGGVLDFRFGDRGHIQVKVEELEPGKKIRWICTDGDPQWHGTTIDFFFDWDDEREICRVYFIHDGWKEETEFMGLCNFSWARYFMSLRSICEGGLGNPYTE